MKKIIVSSKNPVKLEASRKGFEKMFPEDKFEFVSLDSSSEVPD